MCYLESRYLGVFTKTQGVKNLSVRMSHQMLAKFMKR